MLFLRPTFAGDSCWLLVFSSQTHPMRIILPFRNRQSTPDVARFGHLDEWH